MINREQVTFKFALGIKARDTITGFEGTITGRCEYITGCAQYLVQPALLKDVFVEARWMDEDRLVLVGEPAAQVQNEWAGGDAPAPTK